ncbi:hypothetical protein [Synechococcus sp. WH 8016]|uniref:hypothetical protein n=1 Tax=Synechococcus sp. WH 8016 TaxID=166318 RepID=UPI00022D9004|nr:hypothetical protein [Synechococcus sp. WH 8016]EHA63584.1 hypothetical protein Syn8016DRAFT_0625 [Synechococcus sp. WH 8016]
MTLIHLHSEPFSRDGNIAADGAARLLGQPALSPLELVIRETIQNSWDASLEIKGTPQYSIRIRHLSSSQMEAMHSFFQELPPDQANEPIAGVLRRFLDSPGLVMEVCDARTQGLDGPTSASRALVDGESANFVNFIRNIGSARDVAHGGGTYGFGKSSLFKISRCQTVVVHSVIATADGLEHRLIGKALGAAFDHDGRRFTGRHWWGAAGEDESGSVDPVLNERAEVIASSLGFQSRTTQEERGTSLMILDPDLEEFDPSGVFANSPSTEIQNHLGARLQDTILWHCWPKFTRRSDGSLPMECRLSILGDDFALPDPETVSPLFLMTKALAMARDKEELIHCQRPKKLLGFFGQSSASFELAADDRFRRHLRDTALIPERLHHVALLRPAELVVRYMEGSINETEQRQWAGVFITDIGKNAEVEKAFAMSEPPAHDDWQPKAAQALTPHQRTYVNVALRRIRERISTLSGSNISQGGLPGGEARSSLAALAGDIGRSLIGAGPGGADGSRPSSSSGTGGRKAALRLGSPVSEGTSLRDGQLVARFRVRLTGQSDTRPSITFTPWVQMDEGAGDPFAPNGKSPEVISVEIDENEVPLSEKGYICQVAQGGTDIQVLVSIPDYVAVGISPEIVAGDEE